MKKYLFVAILATATCFVQAQTKGSNTIGLGIGLQKLKIEQFPSSNSSDIDQQTTGISVSYGGFIKQNNKLGIDLLYGDSKLNATTQDLSTKIYGGKLTYQKYFQLVKTFYAFGGGRGGYNYSEGRMQQEDYLSDFSNYVSTLGAYGGVSWFLSKRFALEADLLSADIGYNKSINNSVGTNGTFKTTSGSFNLNSAGAINNLAFKIHFLF